MQTHHLLTIYGGAPVPNISTLTDDELADLQGDVIREIERRIETSDHPQHEEMADHAKRAHKRLNKIQKILKDTSIIQPMSGGDKTP